MNEFIVWDDIESEFDDETTVVVDKDGNIGYLFTTKKYNDSLKCFPYIGLKDINNKKIYADSSIVEFVYSVGEAVHIGYFYYDKDNLAYKIKILSSVLRSGKSNKFKGRSFLFDSGMIDFKIIDTKQENKLGLIK